MKKLTLPLQCSSNLNNDKVHGLMNPLEREFVSNGLNRCHLSAGLILKYRSTFNLSVGGFDSIRSIIKKCTCLSFPFACLIFFRGSLQHSMQISSRFKAKMSLNNVGVIQKMQVIPTQPKGKGHGTLV